MNSFLILISAICGTISLIYAGLPAAIFSFALGFFSSFAYQQGRKKEKYNVLAELSAKRDPDNSEFVMYVIAWGTLLICLGITAAALVKGVA